MLLLLLVLPSVLTAFTGGSLGGEGSSMEHWGLGGESLGVGIKVGKDCNKAVGWQSFSHLALLCFLGRLMDLRLRFPRLLWFVTSGGTRGGGRRGWKMLGMRGSGGTGRAGGSSSSGGGGVGGWSGGGAGGGKVSSTDGVSSLCSSSGCCE